MSEPPSRPPILLDPGALRGLGRLDLIGRVIANALKGGKRRSRLHGFSTEFSDFKPYTPGDDLRFLDWRIYARTDRLLVRKYEAETSFESMLLLDASPSMAWRWEDTVSKLEYAANLLAAIAFVHIENQDSVGLAADDGRDAEVVPPRSARRQLDRIFAALETLRPDLSATGKEGQPGEAPMVRLVGALESLRRHRGQVVLCSDLEEDPEACAAALESLGARDDDVVVIHLLDRAEVELPFQGATHLVDSETGETLPLAVEDLKATHERTVREFQESWRSRCEGWGMRYLPIDTGTGYVDALLELAV
jgi:uncharacterized protein (DUF58 family)